MKSKPLEYLCTPYTSNDGNLLVGYHLAASLLGRLMKGGHRIFSPIAHCHTAALIEKLPPEFDYWMDVDEAWIDVCDSVLVAQAPNWNVSKGIAHEIDYANSTGKVVRYLHPNTLEVRDTPHDL